MSRRRKIAAIVGGSLVWRNLLTVAQIASSVAITAAVAGVL